MRRSTLGKTPPSSVWLPAGHQRRRGSCWRSVLELKAGATCVSVDTCGCVSTSKRGSGAGKRSCFWHFCAPDWLVGVPFSKSAPLDVAELKLLKQILSLFGKADRPALSGCQGLPSLLWRRSVFESQGSRHSSRLPL